MFTDYEHSLTFPMNHPTSITLQQAEPWLLTVEETATALGITRRAVEGLVQRGTLSKLYFKGRPYLAANDVQWYQWRKKGKKNMIQARENLFVGLNPHLMSLLQTPGTGSTTSLFPSFHSDHITHIKDFLNRYLPNGYLAVTEPSLQIQGKRAFDAPFQKESVPEPDVAIYRQGASSSGDTTSNVAATPTIHLTLELEEQKTIMGIAIYALQSAEHGVYGEPIVRIELLSPANMPGGSYDEVYQLNRTKCLLAETVLVEVDYLHEYPSPIHALPLYPQAAQAEAFNIIVTNPHTKDVAVYFFGIQTPIPIVPLPLGEDTQIAFNFGEPFAYTWDTSRFGTYVDYGQEPLRMNRYRAEDQSKIRARMKEIQQERQ